MIGVLVFVGLSIALALVGWRLTRCPGGVSFSPNGPGMWGPAPRPPLPREWKGPPPAPAWVTPMTVAEIRGGLEDIIEDREHLLDLADEYPVELMIADRRFMFCDEAEFDAVIEKIRGRLAEFDRSTRP